MRNQELIAAAQTGCLESRNRILVMHLGFIASIIIKMVGMERRDDYMSFGIEGFIHGLDRFDIARGFELTTYTVWFVRREISNELKREKRRGRLPIDGGPRSFRAHGVLDELAEREARELAVRFLGDVHIVERQTVMRRIRLGDTCRKLAAEQGVSPQAISNQQKRVFAEIRARIG